jgi:hypothetical protein
MITPAECRERAAECRQMAEREQDFRRQNILRFITQTWSAALGFRNGRVFRNAVPAIFVTGAVFFVTGNWVFRNALSLSEDVAGDLKALTPRERERVSA